jgi:hypothetical protein
MARYDLLWPLDCELCNLSVCPCCATTSRDSTGTVIGPSLRCSAEGNTISLDIWMKSVEGRTADFQISHIPHPNSSDFVCCIFECCSYACHLKMGLLLHVNSPCGPVSNHSQTQTFSNISSVAVFPQGCEWQCTDTSQVTDGICSFTDHFLDCCGQGQSLSEVIEVRSLGYLSNVPRALRKVLWAKNSDSPPCCCGLKCLCTKLQQNCLCTRKRLYSRVEG